MTTGLIERPAYPKRRNGRARRLLGPVRNLEDYVSPNWWCQIFNSIYLKTDGDVVDDRQITSSEIEKFVDVLDIKHDDHILDLCCGHGRHSLELARLGFAEVEGLDRSHYLVSKARIAAKKENLNARFREGDARKLPYAPDSFDVVMILGNSFGYFETVQDDVRVLKEVFRILKPWGKLLVDITNGDYLKRHFQPRSWEWIGKKHFVCRERSLSIDGQRLISREIVTDMAKGLVADQFYAERLYSEQTLSDILGHAGFTDITTHGEIVPASRRNQDLGMMENRLIITALVRKEWTAIRKPRGTPPREVTVVFGDPRKPDILKPSSVFDDDDFYTIDRLKEALRDIAGFEFSYLNDHDTLIPDLGRLRGRCDLVLNLCDEGYGNDPRKELHVPGLLETMGIPYTGAGPQCLAHCYDKSLVRGVAKEMGIPVPDAFLVNPEDATLEFPFEFPVIAKPNFGDSSFGITKRSVAGNLEELLNAVSEIREQLGYDKPIIVEEFLAGRDLTVGIIGNPPSDYRILPIVEEDYSALPPHLPRICGYEAKWDPSSPYWKLKSVPADLPPVTRDIMIQGCIKLFERLECRDYARFDWRLDANGNPKLLEVNPNPGWCWDGHMAKMAGLEGISYSQMLALILKAAEQRLNI